MSWYEVLTYNCKDACSHINNNSYIYNIDGFSMSWPVYISNLCLYWIQLFVSVNQWQVNDLSNCICFCRRNTVHWNVTICLWMVYSAKECKQTRDCCIFDRQLTLHNSCGYMSNPVNKDVFCLLFHIFALAACVSQCFSNHSVPPCWLCPCKLLHLRFLNNYFL